LEIGEAYVAAMRLAGEYAHARREVVVRQVLRILGAQVVGEPVHNHHNFAWEEEHGDRPLGARARGSRVQCVFSGSFALTAKPAFGLEPKTSSLQVKCSTN
jgi:RNA-splicing ligase RtcB